MPAKDTAASHDFTRKIQIQAPTRTPDGQGGSTTTWNTIYTPWANIQNFPHGRGLSRLLKFQQLYPTMNLIIQLRFQKSFLIDATMRILYVSHGINHFYQILGVENTLEADVSIWLLCQELQVQAVN